jgi:hypothetical protein
MIYGGNIVEMAEKSQALHIYPTGGGAKEIEDSNK